MEKKLSRKKLGVCVLGLIVLLLCIGCGRGELISPPNGAIVIADEFDQVLFKVNFSYSLNNMMEEYEPGKTYTDAYTDADDSGKAAIAKKYFTEIASPVKVGSVTIKADSDAQPFEFNDLIVTYDSYDAQGEKVVYFLTSGFPSAQAGKKYTITIAKNVIELQRKGAFPLSIPDNNQSYTVYTWPEVVTAAARFSDDPAVPPEVILQASEHEYDLCALLEIRETGAAAGQPLGDVFDIMPVGDRYTLTLKPNTIPAERLMAYELYAPSDASGRTFPLAKAAPRYGGIVGGSGIIFYPTPASVEYWGEGGLTFTVDADIRNFLDVYLNGVKLTRAVHYDVNMGSTVITLYESYLQTLAAGEHRLRIVFASGEASATVQVGQASYMPEEILLDPPKTGDAAGTYAPPILLAMLFTAACLLRRRAAK